MLVEILIILSVLFFINVWFYKQRRESIELLQMEFSNLPALHDLTDEQQPIILRGCPYPHSLTQAKLVQIPRLDNFPLNDSIILKAYREGTPVLTDGRPILSRDASINFSKELALGTWATHTLKEFVGEFSGITSPFNSIRASAVLGGIGMRRPTAIYTCIIPTEGTYMISLVNKRSESFLPSAWKYRYPTTLTINDTPLVGEIQFIDVIIRPGTMIAIPAHCIYSMHPKAAFQSAVIVEIDSPISTLAAVLDSLED